MPPHHPVSAIYSTSSQNTPHANSAPRPHPSGIFQSLVEGSPSSLRRWDLHFSCPRPTQSMLHPAPAIMTLPAHPPQGNTPSAVPTRAAAKTPSTMITALSGDTAPSTFLPTPLPSNHTPPGYPPYPSAASRGTTHPDSPPPPTAVSPAHPPTPRKSAQSGSSYSPEYAPSLYPP